MCGLVGMAGMITPKDKAAFEDMLIMDQIRGTHSVGVASVNPMGKVVVVKSTDDPVTFLETKEYKDSVFGVGRVLIGHNRAATKGAITAANAHPFEFPHVVGAHNGTLRNQALLPNSAKFEVDSENIYDSINNRGIQETTKDLNGAYALTWWDKRNSTINILRNSERPLYFTTNTDNDVFYWASEPWMLYGALGRRGIKHTEILNLDIHKHLSIPIATGLNTFNRKLGEPVVSPVTPFQHQTTHYPNNQNQSGKLLPLHEERQKKSAEIRNLRKQNTGKKSTQTEQNNSSNKVVSIGGDPDMVRFTVVTTEYYARGTSVKAIGRPINEKTAEIYIWLDATKDKDLISRMELDNPSVEFEAPVRSVFIPVGTSRRRFIISDTKIKEVTKLDRKNKDVVHGNVSTFAYGFKMKPLTKAEFSDRTKIGCACCSLKLVPDYHKNNLLWMSDSVFVCPTCNNDRTRSHEIFQLRRQFDLIN